MFGERVGAALVACVAGMTERPRFLLSKGGITSSDVATQGLGMTRAEVRTANRAATELQHSFVLSCLSYLLRRSSTVGFVYSSSVFIFRFYFFQCLCGVCSAVVCMLGLSYPVRWHGISIVYCSYCITMLYLFVVVL